MHSPDNLHPFCIIQHILGLHCRSSAELDGSSPLSRSALTRAPRHACEGSSTNVRNPQFSCLFIGRALDSFLGSISSMSDDRLCGEGIHSHQFYDCYDYVHTFTLSNHDDGSMWPLAHHVLHKESPESPAIGLPSFNVLMTASSPSRETANRLVSFLMSFQCLLSVCLLCRIR
jgi:hypothetical protein